MDFSRSTLWRTPSIQESYYIHPFFLRSFSGCSHGNRGCSSVGSITDRSHFIEYSPSNHTWSAVQLWKVEGETGPVLLSVRMVLCGYQFTYSVILVPESDFVSPPSAIRATEYDMMTHDNLPLVNLTLNLTCHRNLCLSERKKKLWNLNDEANFFSLSVNFL